jgi:PKD repeat protein
MMRKHLAGLLLAILVLPAQAEIPGNGFVGLTSDLGDGVNSTLVEWAPWISADGLTLIFCSCDRPGGHGACDLYIATRPDRTSRFDRVENMGPTINTGTHEYNGMLSRDGQTLIITRADTSNFWRLWVATRSDPSDPFGAPVPLDAVNGAYLTAAPHLSSDELALFITTTRPGGKGGDDIWVSTRLSAEDPFGFGAPVLLEDYFPGSTLNGPTDDWSSTLTEDGLAIFCSDSWTSARPGGKGASDIWVSRRESVDDPFGAPINLSDVSLTPINSSADDLAPAVTLDWPLRGAQVFFISTRGGPQDIWQATWEAMPEPTFSASPLAGQPPLIVSFDAAGSSTPAGTEPLTFAWDFGDGVTAQGAPATHTYTEPGRFAATLTATNSVGGANSVSQIVTVSCAPGDVAPWTSADVGSPVLPGSAAKDGDDILLCAGGKTLVGKSDDFNFTYREVTGDFATVVRISDVMSWGTGAVVGLMVRETMNASSQHVAILVDRRLAGPVERLRYREEEGGSAGTVLGSAIDIPVWLRLERRGELIVALGSPDGTVWEEIGRQTIPGLSETVLCGVAACGADSGDPAKPFTPLRARLSGLAIVPVDANFLRGDANVDGAADISDAVFVLGHLFLGGPKPTCGKAADTNDDGSVDISDPVFLLGYLFLGETAPNDPLGTCGLDPTPDGLTCESFAKCP